MKIVINEVKKNSIHGLNSRLEGTEERISEFKDKTIEITQSKQQTQKGTPHDDKR